MVWYITNFPNFTLGKELFISNLNTNKKKDIFIHIEGFLLPRLHIYDKYKIYKQTDLVSLLYKKYGTNFIKHIKGIFNIIIIENNSFYIFSDRHAINKIFYYKYHNFFYITNNLKLLTNKFKLKLDKENISIFFLISHFLPGQSLYKNVRTNMPASYLHYEENELNQYFYWSPKRLVTKRTSGKTDFNLHAFFWKKINNSYIEYFNSKRIAITVTGGNDSRMVLSAIVKNQKQNIYAYTYGDPNSLDVKISKNISSILNLKHKNYFVKQPTDKWLSENIHQILNYGNSLINLHRAHRNDAAKKHIMNYKNIDIIFTGLVGGEYLKEPNYDDIVIPKILHHIMKHNAETSILILKNALSAKGINVKLIDLTSIYDKFVYFINLANGLTSKEKKFIYTYYFYGCSHHIQDSIILSNYFKKTVNPFMDIDFLELMSKSKYWYLNNRNPFYKLFHSYYFVKITDILTPELSNTPYAKKGFYSANELIYHKFYYLLKRSLYFIFRRKNFIQNFPIGLWMYNYVKKELQNIHPELLKFVNTDLLKSSLTKTRHHTAEEKWHFVTNPVNISINLKYYEKN